jgi:cell division protein FtsB
MAREQDGDVKTGRAANGDAQRQNFSAQMGEFIRRNINWFLAIAAALLLLQDVFGTHGVIAMRRSQQEAARVQKEINQLDEENRQLETGVKSLKSDPSAIERIAREEMGLAKPGEFIFKLPAKNGASANASPQSPSATPSH